MTHCMIALRAKGTFLIFLLLVNEIVACHTKVVGATQLWGNRNSGRFTEEDRAHKSRMSEVLDEVPAKSKEIMSTPRRLQVKEMKLGDTSSFIKPFTKKLNEITLSSRHPRSSMKSYLAQIKEGVVAVLRTLAFMCALKPRLCNAGSPPRKLGEIDAVEKELGFTTQKAVATQGQQITPLSEFGSLDLLYTVAMSFFCVIPLIGIYTLTWPPGGVAHPPAGLLVYMKLGVVAFAFVLLIALQTLKGYRIGQLMCCLNLGFRFVELGMMSLPKLMISLPKLVSKARDSWIPKLVSKARRKR